MNATVPAGRTAAEVACWTAWLHATRTDPLTVSEVAAAFGVSWDNAGPLLAGISGVESVLVGTKTRYRIPLIAMPAAFVARELLAAGAKPPVID